MRPRRLLGLALGAAAVAAALPAASTAATPVTSENWAGYTVLRPPTRFNKVTATWVEPNLHCRSGQPTFSAFWVGLGGVLPSSSGALEQAGTEADCGAQGRSHHFAWFEMLPAPQTTIPLTIRPGDVITDTVSVTGHVVHVRLADRTRRRVFTRNVRVQSTDLSSAEWVAEAPAACDASLNNCAILPLSDFGTVNFSAATATTTNGPTRSISYPGWATFAIQLSSAGGGPFVAASTPFAASPTPLAGGGRAFSVVYSVPATASAHTARTRARRHFPSLVRSRVR